MNLFDAFHKNLIMGKKIKAFHWRKECYLIEKTIETAFNGFICQDTCILDQDDRWVVNFYKDFPLEWRMYEWEVVE